MRMPADVLQIWKETFTKNYHVLYLSRVKFCRFVIDYTQDFLWPLPLRNTA